MRKEFDREKLLTDQRSISFVGWAEKILEALPKSRPVSDQLQRVSIFIPLNISEANGKYAPADRHRSFDRIRGSAPERSTFLDALCVRHRIAAADANDGKTMLIEIVSFLVGLIKSNSEHRLHVDPPLMASVL